MFVRIHSLLPSNGSGWCTRVWVCMWEKGRAQCLVFYFAVKFFWIVQYHNFSSMVLIIICCKIKKNIVQLNSDLLKVFGFDWEVWKCNPKDCPSLLVRFPGDQLMVIFFRPPNPSPKTSSDEVWFGNVLPLMQHPLLPDQNGNMTGGGGSISTFAILSADFQQPY